MSWKDCVVNVFMTLARDERLLELLEVPSRNIADIRNQIVETVYPDTTTADKLSRICIYETPSSLNFQSGVERNCIEIDIYVHKDVHKRDRRAIIIAEHIRDLLDYRQREKRGIKPASIAGFQFSYYQRIPHISNHRDWVGYGLVFHYDSVKL